MTEKQNLLPHFIGELAFPVHNPMIKLSQTVWAAREEFVRWPRRQYLFWPGLTRHKDERRKDCYTFSAAQKAILAQASLPEDGRNNGPAILAFLLAGGERPVRRDFPRHHWSTHRIYDGQYPPPNKTVTTHSGGVSKPSPHSAQICSAIFNCSLGRRVLSWSMISVALMLERYPTFRF